MIVNQHHFADLATAYQTRIVTNAKGHGFVLSSSEVPCQPESRELLSREWSPVWSFWQPEEKISSENVILLDIQVDRRGSLCALLFELPNSQLPEYVSRLYALERPVYQ